MSTLFLIQKHWHIEAQKYGHLFADDISNPFPCIKIILCWFKFH